MSFAASGDNSKNGAPESSSVMTRWRGRSLPRARWRSRARGGPPSAAVARRLSSSAISCRMAASLARNSLDLQSTFEAILDTEPRLSPERIFRNEPLFAPIITRARFEKLCPPVCVAKSIGRERIFSAGGRRKHPIEGESLMRKQHTLLAGVAALALFATSGIASAQQTQQDHKGAGGAAQSGMHSQRSDQGGKNQTAKQGLKNQGAQQGKNQNAMSKQSSGQNAQNESKMQSRQGNAGKMSNAGKGQKSLNRSAQEQKQKGQRSFTAQEQNKGARATNRTAQGQQKQLNAQSKATQSKNGQFATEQSNRRQRGASTAQR